MTNITSHKGGCNDPGNIPSPMDRFPLFPCNGCSFSLQKSYMMTTYSSWNHRGTNLHALQWCHSVLMMMEYKQCRSTTSISCSYGPSNKCWGEILTLACPFSLSLFAFQSKWVSLLQFFFVLFCFYRRCKKRVKCDWKHYLSLWPVVKQQLSWRALLFLSEMDWYVNSSLAPIMHIR